MLRPDTAPIRLHYFAVGTESFRVIGAEHEVAVNALVSYLDSPVTAGATDTLTHRDLLLPGQLGMHPTPISRSAHDRAHDERLLGLEGVIEDVTHLGIFAEASKSMTNSQVPQIDTVLSGEQGLLIHEVRDGFQTKLVPYNEMP